MSDTLIVSAAELLVVIIAIVRPIMSLNASIVRLSTTIENFEERYDENHEEMKNRVKTHGEQIDDLEKKSENHEVRIQNLEGK